jgi:phosphoribosylformylglycinamidine cyclo-ligase
VSVAQALLEPTAIYVRAVLALLASGARVHGLAHITGDGLRNLTRLSRRVGFEIDDPLPVVPICAWLCEQGALDPAQARQVFNMGLGFVAVVEQSDADLASELLAGHHPGTRAIGRVTAAAGEVSLPGLALRL